MKLLTTISIIAALGLSACNSKSVDSTKAKTEDKVMEEKATDTSTVDTSANTMTEETTEVASDTSIETKTETETEKKEAAAEEPKEAEKETAPVTQVNITDTYWKLVTLEGKDIGDAENPHDQPHFMLNTKDNKVTGNDGCNGFFGGYTLDEGKSRIKFDQLGATMRACAETVVNAQEYMQVLGQADSYSIRNGFLELYIGRRAPLAVFKAITDKAQ